MTEDRYYNDGLSESQRQILDFVDTAEVEQDVDEEYIKKLCSKLKKTLNNEQKESIELIADLKALNCLATSQFLNLVIKLQLHDTLNSLLEHTNNDVVLGVINLCCELTDEANESKHVNAFVDLLNLKLIPQIYQIQDDEKKYKIIELLDNLVSLDSKYVQLCVELIPSFVNQLRPFNVLSSYIAEMLSICSLFPENQIVKYMEVVLETLSIYKNKDPKQEEREYMDNLFNCLCAILSTEEGKKQFRVLEGIELMMLMLKSSKSSRIRALRVLNFATQVSKEGQLNTDRLCEVDGIKWIFSIFMQKDFKILSKYKDFIPKNDLENVSEIIVHMLRQSSHKSRIHCKFTENNHEKLIQTVNLIMQFFEKKQSNSEQEYLDNLENGLFLVSLLCFILGLVNEKEVTRVLLKTVKFFSYNDVLHEFLKYSNDLFANELLNIFE